MILAHLPSSPLLSPISSSTMQREHCSIAQHWSQSRVRPNQRCILINNKIASPNQPHRTPSAAWHCTANPEGARPACRQDLLQKAHLADMQTNQQPTTSQARSRDKRGAAARNACNAMLYALCGFLQDALPAARSGLDPPGAFAWVARFEFVLKPNNCNDGAGSFLFPRKPSKASTTGSHATDDFSSGSSLRRTLRSPGWVLEVIITVSSLGFPCRYSP